MFQFISWTLAAAIGAILANKYELFVTKNKPLSPVHGEVYRKLMRTETRPQALNKMASVFGHEGYTEQSSKLKQRAKLAGIPKEKRQAWQRIFQHGMTLKQPQKVLFLAKAFEKQGLQNCADQLRAYGVGLQMSAGLDVSEETFKNETDTDVSLTEAHMPENQ